MMANNNSHLLGEFWKTVGDLDWSRNESLMSVVPELESIISYCPAADVTFPNGRTHILLKE